MVSKKKYVSFLHLRTGIVINPCILLQNLNTTYCYNNCIQIVFLLQGKEEKTQIYFFCKKRKKSLIFLLLNIYVKESQLYFASKQTSSFFANSFGTKYEGHSLFLCNYNKILKTFHQYFQLHLFTFMSKTIADCAVVPLCFHFISAQMVLLNLMR